MLAVLPGDTGDECARHCASLFAVHVPTKARSALPSDFVSNKQTPVAVLAGGVGAARFIRALLSVIPGSEITAIVNTGDDTELHGLHISPDIDTIIYTVAGAIDPERGWGLRDESWTALSSLKRYEGVRPEGSSAAPTWFNLGDRDLATHFYRTARLREGATLSQVTSEIANAWGVQIRVRPMSDEPVRTFVHLKDSGAQIPFQEYFVKHRHTVPVDGITFGGIEEAKFACDDVLAGAQTVVIAPSNPIVSIGPIRALNGVDRILAERRDSVVAISPIVAGSALKGPADRMLTELGHEASVVGVARMYAPICGTLVIDHADANLADAVRAEGMRCVVGATIMGEPEVDAALAKLVLEAGQ